MRASVRRGGTDRRPDRAGEGPLYLRVAGDLERQIRAGTLRVGEKVPSIRAIKAGWRVSTSTALQAYGWLETRGLIGARPRSGFYVRVPFADLAPEAGFEPRRSVPRDVGLDARLGKLLEMRAGLGALQMGAAVPSADFYPVTKLNRATREIIRQDPAHSARYEFPPGNAELRRQIARHASRQIGRSSWEEIVVTTGTMEGLSLGLRAVAKAGDGIAVESPTFFGILQLVKSLGMQAVEIPTDPKTGMDLSALEQAMRRKRIKASVVISNCHNPLGYVLPDTAKRDIAELSHRYEIPVLEDDMLGDAAYEEPRPRTIKSYDRGGLVLIVSSFSKVLGPGYRVGWMQAGRWQSTVEQLQFITTVAAPSLPQRVIASFLEGGGYERHLRHVRLVLADRVRMASRAIAQYFPPDTRVTRPAGGFLLWVQLPPSVDAITVFDRALEHRIAVVPGPMFSASGQFGHCLRLSCGHPWSSKVEESLAILGSIAGRLMASPARGGRG